MYTCCYQIRCECMVICFRDGWFNWCLNNVDHWIYFDPFSLHFLFFLETFTVLTPVNQDLYCCHCYVTFKIKMLFAKDFSQSNSNTFHCLLKQISFTFTEKMLAMWNFQVSWKASSEDSYMYDYFYYCYVVGPTGNLEFLSAEGLVFLLVIIVQFFLTYPDICTMSVKPFL